MASTTATRQRELHDVMERYIERRRRAFLPEVRRIAAEAGVSESALLFLAYTRQLDTGGAIPLARLRRRAVYATKEPWRARLDEVVAAGLAEPAEGGWRLTARGREVVERTWEATHAQQRALPLPAEPLQRVVETLEGIVRDVPATDDQRLASVRRTAPADRERANLATRAEQAMFETAVLHDDGHIGAWERAGYDGPTLDVLTHVWRGCATYSDLSTKLGRAQDPADLDRAIAGLERRGELARDGEALALTAKGRAARERIEEETDREGFARWPRGDELEALIADVEALVAALPSEAELPVGPTH